MNLEPLVWIGISALAKETKAVTARIIAFGQIIMAVQEGGFVKKLVSSSKL